MLTMVWLLAKHPCCRIVYCPVIKAVINVLADSFVVKEGPDHVYLAWDVSRFSFDTFCEVDLLLVAIRNNNCVVTI